MSAVQDFERAFADYVGARYAIALCNGTATLHTALVALGVKPGDLVAVPSLTMSATTIAVLHAGAVPVFVDVDPDTWLQDWTLPYGGAEYAVPVSLYGLHFNIRGMGPVVDDAAQTLRPHSGCAFTSYSFQSSKILALGEGGILVTNDEALATRARELSSLGYRMAADQPRIDKLALKDPSYARHYTLGWNYRMAESVAALGVQKFAPWAIWNELDELYHELPYVEVLKAERRKAAALYLEAVAGCSWIKPQHVPDGWTHDYWAYPVALEAADLWHPFVDAIEQYGGTRPFAAWRLTYQEPAFRHLAEDGCCPVAEDLQPRIVAGQTNDLVSAEINAHAWAKAIKEMGG